MRIQRTIFWELLLNFLFIAVAIGFSSVLGAAVNASFRARGTSLLMTLSLLPPMLANVLPYLVPLALLVAVVITYGRLAAERELTAIRMAGIHLARILSPALILAAVLSMISFELQAEWTPYFHQRQGELFSRVAADALSSASRELNEISYEDRGQGIAFFMSWSHRSADGTFNNVFLSYRDAEQVHEGRAQRASLFLPRRPGRPPRLVLRVEGFKAVDARIEVQGDFQIALDFSRARRVRDSDSTLTELFCHLRHAERVVAAGPPPGREKWWKGVVKRLPRTRFEIYSREALALTNLIFVLIGVPIAILMRRANRLIAFAIAAGIVLVGYYPLTYLGQALGNQRLLDPLVAAHGPGLLLAGLGAWLLYRLFRI